jgi:hypothetical protein
MGEGMEGHYLHSYSIGELSHHVKKEIVVRGSATSVGCRDIIEQTVQRPVSLALAIFMQRPLNF